MLIFILICIGVYFIIIRPFLRSRQEENFAHYMVLPPDVKHMINQEHVFELAELLVRLELNEEYELAKIVLNGIDSKGFSFARRVDKIRNELRIQAGLGPLKNF